MTNPREETSAEQLEKKRVKKLEQINLKSNEGILKLYFFLQMKIYIFLIYNILIMNEF